jgi:DNA mismatch repair protein MutL
LLENSIDAKSTLIEIYLQDQGRDGILIKDNGYGISKENLEKIAQKGCTSKLK